MTPTIFCAGSFWRRPMQAGAALLALAVATAGAQTNFGAVNVGASATSTVTVTIPAAATVGSITVVTQGAIGLDFTNGSGGSCTAGTTYQAQQNCTVQINFKPAYAGERYGAALLLDGSGNVIASAPLDGNGVGPQVAFGGGASIAFAPMVNGVAFNDPFDATVDGKGNLYITDQNNSRVVELPAGNAAPIAIDPIVAGKGLVHPGGVAVDGAGNLYISDLDRNFVVEVPVNGGAVNVINPMVNGIGLHYPCGMVIDGAGDLYIADVDNGRVVEVPIGGAVAVAIDPLVDGAKLSYPVTLALDTAGDLFIADLFANRVVEIAANGGAATAIDPSVNGQSLHFPYGVAVDAAGDLFIADADNRVVEVPAGGGAATAITPTVNGEGLEDPIGIGLDAAGNLFIADSQNNRVVEDERGQPPAINFAATAAGTVSSDSPQTVMIQNVGNAPLTIPAPATGVNPEVSANFTLNGSAASACPMVTPGAAQPGTLAAGATCVLPVSFQPAATGTVYGTLTLTDSDLNAAGPAYATQAIALSGAAPVATVSATMLAFGPQEVTTASAPQQVTLTNTGSAALMITNIVVAGTNSSAFVFPNPCGGSLAAGANCTIAGHFTPAAAGSMAATLTISDNASGSPQVVSLNGAGVYPVTVAVTPSSLNVTTALAFTVTIVVAGANGEPTPTGTIVLTSGTYNLGTATLTNGSATIDIPPGALAVGTDNIDAMYAPDNTSNQIYASALGENTVTVTASSTSTAPATATAVATAVTATAATLAGTVNPNGADTHSWFLWGTSSTLSGATQTTVQDLGAAAGNVAVTVPIQGLAASTTYYYQAVAQNSLGTTSGAIFSFTTEPSPYFQMVTGAPMSIVPGATTGNTSTVSVTPWYGFTGAVTLSCAITPTAASDAPTCSVPTTVTISGTTAQTATLIVNTTAATATNQPAGLPWRAMGGAVLACVVLLFTPLRRRNWLALFVWVALFAAAAGMGCSGGASTGGGGG
jgi:sugar lactone lactonase YvrE